MFSRWGTVSVNFDLLSFSFAFPLTLGLFARTSPASQQTRSVPQSLPKGGRMPRTAPVHSSRPTASTVVLRNQSLPVTRDTPVRQSTRPSAPARAPRGQSLPATGRTPVRRGIGPSTSTPAPQTRSLPATRDTPVTQGKILPPSSRSTYRPEMSARFYPDGGLAELNGSAEDVGRIVLELRQLQLRAQMINQLHLP